MGRRAPQRSGKMSIYDRDYVREDTTRGGTWRSAIRAWHIFLALNVAVFLVWLFTGGFRSAFMDRNFTLSWEGITEEYRFHTLLTYAFSQYDFNHILFNMIALWVFGGLVEDRYGRRGFALVYLLSALGAAAAQFGLDFVRGTSIPMLGASGAVMGLMAVAACVFPEVKIFLFGVVPVRLKWLALIYVIMDLSGTAGVEVDRVAHAAHLGGALCGFLLWRFASDWLDEAYARGRGPSLWERVRGFVRRRPKLRIVEPHKDELPAESAAVDARTATRVDELLAKIHREGMDALSAEEKEFLKAASTKYRHT
jgi:membrane associated rhomboid family serine protease